MVYLEWAGKLISNVKGFYSEMNPATLTGAIDIIIIKQEDGSFKTSPWHVRFGKMGVFWTNQNNVEIEINGKPVNLPMKLGTAGEAFFLQECEDFSLINNSNSNNADKTIISVDEEKNRYKINYDGGGSFEESDPSPLQDEVPSCQEFPFHSLLNEVRFQSEEFDKVDVVDSEKEGSLEPEKVPSLDENLFEMEMDTYGKISPIVNMEATNTTDRRKTLTSCAVPDIEEDILPPFSKMRCNSLPEIHLDDISQNLIKDETNDDGKDGDSGGEDDVKCIVGSLPSCSSGFLTSSKVITSVVDNVEWKWGQLPVPSAGNNSNNRISSEDGKLEDAATALNEDVKITSSNGGKKVKKELVKDIYLEDLKDDDPEMVSLYLYNNVSSYSSAAKISNKDIDCNSDPGLPVTPYSAPHSPVPFDENPSSTRVRALSCSATDRDGSSLVSSSSRLMIDPTMTSLSSQSTFSDLSMSLCGGVNDLTESVLKEKFEKFKVTYEQLSSDPNILTNPSLVIFMDGKYYKWAVAAPMIMSMLVFKKSLTDAARESLLKCHMPRKVTSQKRGWLGGWWTSREKPIAAPLVTSVAIKSSPSLAVDSGNESDGSTTAILDKPSDSNVVQQPALSSAAVISTSATAVENTNPAQSQKIPHEKLFRSLELTSKQIESLNLHDGMNDVTFSVTTKYQGTTKCACCIFLWNWNDKIVVSDIDGTITKSDVLGQVLPLISSNWSDWSQVGIANLYTLIHQNGYRFMYLSARAIGQSRLTRDYLRSVKQGGYLLPIGPLLLSPSSLRSAFHKEVIERKPEEFKIKCLKNILSLFPSCVTNPFTAGFGNRINDVWAYSTVGIPKSRIFIVDKKGQIRIEKSTTFSSTYSKLSDIVDQVFPSVAVDTEFSLFNFWRDPSLNFSEIDAQQFLQSKKTKKAIKSTLSMPPSGSSK